MPAFLLKAASSTTVPSTREDMVCVTSMDPHVLVCKHVAAAGTSQTSPGFAGTSQTSPYFLPTNSAEWISSLP